MMQSVSRLERSVDAEILRFLDSPKLAIPPAPLTALKLQEVIGRDDFGGREIVDVVATDAALAAVVLRYANSASRAGRMEVTELPAAVARVGLRSVAQIALTKELGASFGGAGLLTQVRSRLWQRSLASAIICQAIAKARGWNADQAFTAGLLHDFGAAVVLAAAERVIAGREDVARSAEAWFDFAMENHLEVGRLVADDWDLGELLHSAMVHHHTPAASERYQPMLELLLTSDRVCNLLEHYPSVTPDLLGEFIEDPKEVTLVVEQLPTLAARMERLSETARPVGHTESAIAEQPAAATTGLMPFDAKVSLVEGGAQLKAPEIAADRVVVHSDRTLPVNTLAQLCIEPSQGRAFEFWCNVLRAEHTANGIRVAFRPFALSGVAKRQFESLLQAA